MTTSATPVIPGVGVKVPKPARCGHRLNNVQGSQMHPNVIGLQVNKKMLPTQPEPAAHASLLSIRKDGRSATAGLVTAWWA